MQPCCFIQLIGSVEKRALPHDDSQPDKIVFVCVLKNCMHLVLFVWLFIDVTTGCNFFLFFILPILYDAPQAAVSLNAI